MVVPAVVIGLSACTLTPEATPPTIIPDIETLPRYLNEQQSDEGTTTLNQSIAWWRRIGGPDLDHLVEQLIARNFDLAEARARVRQAEARTRQARSGRLPAISANGEASRTRSQGLDGSFSWSDGYAVGASGSWAADIFGGIRTAERSARLAAAAARASYGTSEQQQIAALAKSYVAAATLQRRLALALSIAESFRVTYQLTDERYQAGSRSVTASDVQIAKQNLDTALVDIPDLQTQLTTQLLAIDAQLARLPGTTARSFRGTLNVDRTPQVPVGLPATLLTQRPDVATAELRYRAALEDIGSARADLFPALTLTASLTFQDEDLSGLFSWQDHIANLAGSLVQPVFQGGRLRAAIKLERAEAEELAAAYGRTAITAVTEVETALAEQAGFAEQLRRLESAVTSAQTSNEIAQRRFREGLNTILSVLETQRSLNNTRQSVLLTEQALLNARIDLFLSLGGAWFETDTPNATADVIGRVDTRERRSMLGEGS
ncbi:MAG: efflux transporter outer membrane subunit [Alphaproteobacteria bacterium]